MQRKAPPRVAHSSGRVRSALVPEDVGVWVAAQSASGQANGLGGRRVIRRQIRRGGVAGVLGVCETLCGSIVDDLHTQAGRLNFLRMHAVRYGLPDHKNGAIAEGTLSKLLAKS
jgi:hypothetical protein